MTRLKKLDFFEEVEITPTEGEQPELMNLNVRVRENSPVQSAWAAASLLIVVFL